MRLILRILLVSVTLSAFLFLLFKQPNSDTPLSFSNLKKSAASLVQPKVKACFAVLVRNRELEEFRVTMRQLEDRFNHNHNYPYVFMNDEPFTDEFKRKIGYLTKAKVYFELIPKKFWGIPPHIDHNRTIEALKDMGTKRVPYGDSLPYRNMIRFESGFFSQMERMKEFDYYWRVEPKVKFMCDIDEDPFLFMQQNNKKYGFTIAMSEFMATIPTLFPTIKSWMKYSNTKLHKNSSLKFVSDDQGRTYNGCHFWSNFEIGSLDMLRSESYRSFFDYLDAKGGFFYERWGDAPVHSLYVAMFIDKSEIHFFDNIGYQHDLYQNCPIDPVMNQKCICNPRDSNSLKSGCFDKWMLVNGRQPFRKI